MIPDVNAISDSWKGFDEVRFLFVFGDSYSSVGAPEDPVPTKDEPLGVEYPGHTYNERDEPNWVGYLVANYHSILAYDYAEGGSTVSLVKSQIQRRFLPSAGRKPPWAPWSASNSLFVTWVGLNDCGFGLFFNEADFTQTQEPLFKQQEALYAAGARNFLFIDVPPLLRCPGFRTVPVQFMADDDRLHDAYSDWNQALYSHIAKFSGNHPDVTVMLFSAYETFTRVLDDPAEYGFNPTTAHDAGGSIWHDYLHPTSGMHAIIAHEVVEFLSTQPPISSHTPTMDNPQTWTSTVIRAGHDWPGITGLKHLIVLGASYCDVGYTRKSPHPTQERPLGVPYPGRTWTEHGTPNWVGHLVTKLKAKGNKVLAYDFARGGDTVDGIKRQVHQEFLPELALQPEWAPWKASDSLVLVWVGINDCLSKDKIDPSVPLDQLFALMKTVCDAGVQNFLLVDLPPLDRSPHGTQMTRTSGEKFVFEEWNDVLRSSATRFAGDNPGVTVLVYSSHETFSKVLDSPATYGFRVEDVQKAAGSIWVDHVHPTSKMHDEVAKDMVSFLSGVSRSGIS